MLSDHECGVLLAGIRMNWGYPFSFGCPYVPGAAEDEIIDHVGERLRGMRRENQERQTLVSRQFDLAPHEASILIAILEACLAECRGNSISIHLHLQAENKDEVRGLVDRLSR